MTTTDEVFEDDLCSSSECEEALLCCSQNITSQLCAPCEAIQNKNNNAWLIEKHRSPSPDIEKQPQETTLTVIEKTMNPPRTTELMEEKLYKMEQKADFNFETKSKAVNEELKSQRNIVLQKSQSFVFPTVQRVQKVPGERLKTASMVQRFSTETA